MQTDVKPSSDASAKPHRLAASLKLPAWSLMAAALAVPAHALATPPRATPQLAPVTQRMDFEVYLPLRDKAGLAALLEAQQTQGSHSYHRWLTPVQFGARFGPTQESLNKAAAALRTAGPAFFPQTLLSIGDQHGVDRADRA